MRKPTTQDRIATYLTIRMGAKEVVPSSAKRFRQFEHGIGRTSGRMNYYFVGRNGAVRIGTCISRSYSVTDGVQRTMREWENRSFAEGGSN